MPPDAGSRDSVLGGAFACSFADIFRRGEGMLRHLAWHWRKTRQRVRCAAYGRRHRDLFDRVAYYCLFIGYPRSGHSVLGAMLDAHPDAVISHEMSALRYVRRGYSRDELFALTVLRARDFARNGSISEGYSYAIPGQWQGRFRRLLVIGDKRGGETARALAQDPAVLELVEARTGKPLKLLHVTRNPFDNVSTISRRHGMTLLEAADYYAGMCAAVQSVLARRSVLTVRHEDVVENPRSELTRVCAYLGLNPEPAYLDACSTLVFAAPRRSRDDIEWNADLRSRVEGYIERFEFLRSYSWED